MIREIAWILVLMGIVNTLWGCGSFPNGATQPWDLSLGVSSHLLTRNPTVVDNRDLALSLAYLQLGGNATPDQLAAQANQLVGSGQLSGSDIFPLPSVAQLDFVTPSSEVDEVDLAAMLAVIQLGSGLSPAQLADRVNALTGSQRLTATDIVRIPGLLPTPSPLPSPTAVLLVPQTVNGTLSATDPLDPQFPGQLFFVNDYLLTGGVAGQPIQVTLRSGAFDAFLQHINGSTGAVLASDDDSGGGSNAQLQIIPTAAFPSIVRVGSFGPNQTGDYTLQSVGIPN